MESENVLDTCLELLKQRNYVDIQQLDSIFSIYARKSNDKKVCLVFHKQTKFNVAHVQEYTSRMKHEDIDHVIIVIQNTVTPMAKKVIENSCDIDIELFVRDELVFNITKHVLVPEHIKLDESDAALIRKRFGSKLPILSRNDPVSRFYGFKRLDIIKIIRKKTGFVAYRIVK